MLRNATALAAVTGRPVRVVNIRGGRSQPGLRPQHLLGLRALAEICRGELSGAEIGSTEIALLPGDLRAHTDWRLDVGTAGSVTLLLQSLLPALSHAPAASSLTLIGGTDVPFSPPIDYVLHTLLPALRTMGVEAEVELIRRGFYPKGGGEVHARVRPCEALRGVAWTERARVIRARGRAYSQGLPAHIVPRLSEAATPRNGPRRIWEGRDRVGDSRRGPECRVRHCLVGGNRRRAHARRQCPGRTRQAVRAGRGGGREDAAS